MTITIIFFLREIYFFYKECVFVLFEYRVYKNNATFSFSTITEDKMMELNCDEEKENERVDKRYDKQDCFVLRHASSFCASIVGEKCSDHLFEIPSVDHNQNGWIVSLHWV